MVIFSGISFFPSLCVYHVSIHTYTIELYLLSGYNNIFIRPFMCEFIWKVTLIVCACGCICSWWFARFILSCQFWAMLPFRWAYVCGKFAGWMQFTGIMNWGREATANPIEKCTEYALEFCVHSPYSTGISFELTFGVLFFYFAIQFLAMHSIHNDDQKQAWKKKKRCWLCNQVYFMLFRLVTSKQNANSYQPTQAFTMLCSTFNKFPFVYNFYDDVNWLLLPATFLLSLIFFLLYQAPKRCAQFFLSD